MATGPLLRTVIGAMDRFERFIGLDREPSRGERIRWRLVYRLAWAFMALQVVNWFTMYRTYGEINAQHAVSVGVCIALFGISCMMRWTRSVNLFGAIFTVLIFGGVAAAGMAAENPLIEGGIGTALLPLLAFGTIVVALASNALWVVIYCTVSITYLFGIHSYSTALLAAIPDASLAGLPTGTGSSAEVVRQAFMNSFDQSLTQAVICVVMSGAVVYPFARRLYISTDELQTAVQTARNAEAAKGDFLAHMSHEIRGPLGGVVAMAGMLNNQDLPDRAAQQAAIIQRAANQLMDIVNDVLDTARLEAGQLALNTAPFDLRETLEGLVGLYAPGASDKGLWLGLDWADALPTRYVGDELRLRQIVTNYLTNAVKFTDAGGVRIAVRGEAAPTHSTTHVALRIFVQDTGAGIAPEQQATVFERFGQSASGAAQGSKGTGLGLAIVSELASLMGGTVGVSSVVGQGSCFHVALTLPRADADHGELAA